MLEESFVYETFTESFAEAFAVDSYIHNVAELVPVYTVLFLLEFVFIWERRPRVDNKDFR